MLAVIDEMIFSTICTAGISSLMGNFWKLKILTPKTNNGLPHTKSTQRFSFQYVILKSNNFQNLYVEQHIEFQTYMLDLEVSIFNFEGERPGCLISRATC